MSCTAVQTYKKGDGTEVNFTFSFQYIEQSDVKVGIYDDTTKLYVDKAQDDATYGWSFSNLTTVTFVTAPPADATAPSGNNIRIYRDTDVDDMEAEFYPGSSIRAQDLNDNFDQLRMSIEEGQCYFSEGQQTELDNRYWSKLETYDSADQAAQTATSDDEVMSAQASSDRHDTILSDNTSTPVQPGKLWANTSINTLNWWDGPNSTWVNSGPAGPKGDKGDQGEPGTPGSGGAVYKGQTDFTIDAPADPENGDFWINTVTGTGAWDGFIGDAVSVNDRAIYNSTTSQWDLISTTDSDWQTISNVITPANASIDTIRETNISVGDATIHGTIEATDLTASRSYKLPDKNGTIAMVGDGDFWVRDETEGTLTPVTNTDTVIAPSTIQSNQYNTTGDTFTAAVEGTDIVSASIVGGLNFSNVPVVKVNNRANIHQEGTIRTITNTIPDGTGVDLRGGNNLIYNGTHNILNPTNVNIGQTGTIHFQTAAGTFEANWRLSAESYPADTIAPYQVITASVVAVGLPTDVSA